VIIVGENGGTIDWRLDKGGGGVKAGIENTVHTTSSIRPSNIR
jgi:hypothetical protein